MFERVDLPAPFSPRSACTSPSAASKWTPSLATTPGNRFVIPRSSTAAGMEGGRAGRSAPPARRRSALRAPDDALHEPVHRVEVLDRRPVPLLDAQRALLVVDRAAELVPLARDDPRPLLRDQRLRRRRDLRPVRRQLDHPVLDRPVVEAR